jgi:GR25 family glycosyltransferase involved in LPS biosynthesis
MEKVLDFFGDTYYINLDHRVDRREKFEKDSYELGVKAKRFSAIRPKLEDIPDSIMQVFNHNHPNDSPERAHHLQILLGEVGCSLSHRAVVKEAKDRGLNNVLIFEDDCKFLPEWKSEIEKVTSDLNTIEWDLIYFGGNLTSPTIPITDNLGSATGTVWTSHSYAVNRSFFDSMLAVDINHNYLWAYDLFLSSFCHYKKVIISKKILCVQESNVSDIRGYNTDPAQKYQIEGWAKYST